MKHHHSIVYSEPGQVLTEAAISFYMMWVVMLDGDTFNIMTKTRDFLWFFLFLGVFLFIWVNYVVFMGKRLVI